ncbi:MAG: restriction endonuclease subunit S [Phascolarctobacterium sp.]|nr:restriction endonuclease subunit S [Phascolarctobacterium sp.]MBQ9763136.1 restriction endonuclease subunit S [Phascolarctobacterium sp.]
MSISNDLRQAVLQAAIQGKLTKQLPEDGNARDLLDKLKLWHKNLKPSKEELNYTAIDFDIPPEWCWVELNQFFNFVDYRGKTPHKITNGVFLVTASNIKQGYMDYTRKEYISLEEFEDRKSRGITAKGDLLFTTEAPLGNVALCDLDECSCGQRIITFKTYIPNTVCNSLFMYFILAPSFQRQLIDNCTGTTAKGIKAEKLKHLRIPLPPLAEQKRIVAKVEELMAKIDDLEKTEKELEALKKAFPADMKAALLQAAMQGKLTEQLPEDGDAKDLLEQIKAEKAKLIKEGKLKKEKPLQEITEDEKPFDIPENWEWVRLGDILIKLTDGAHSTPKYFSKGVPFISVKDVSSGNISFSDCKYISEQEHNELYKRCNPEKGDVLLTKVGTTGIPVIVDTDIEFSLFVSVALLKFNQSLLYNRYLVDLIKAPVVQKHAEVNTKGVGNKNWVMRDIANTMLPLPPFAEQKRIVEKLEKLLPLCDGLK